MIAITIDRWSKFLFFMNACLTNPVVRFWLCLFLFRVDAGHSRARNLQDCLVGAADEKTRITYRGDRADDSPGGDHLVARLQLGNCRLQLSLLFLLGSNQPKIKDAKDQQHRHKGAAQPANATLKEE